MDERVRRLRSRVERMRGARDETQRKLVAAGKVKTRAAADLSRAEKARAVIQTVARQTQEGLEFRLNELVSLAMASVFEEPYELKCRFEERRGKTECDLVFTRGGNEVDPMGESGGGAVDVAAFALRVAVWSMARPRSVPVLVLDEPFRFVSRDLQTKASALLKEVSERLGLQILMVSHSEDLISSADRVFRVRNKEGVSHATTD